MSDPEFRQVSLLSAVIVFLFFQDSAAGEISLTTLRSQFYQCVSDQDQTEKFISRLENIPHPDPLETAYLAAGKALMAKHVWNPVTKLGWLDRAEQTMAEAIRQDPDNPEIRFLRFSWQHFLPGFLGRSPNLNEDRKVIISGLIREKKSLSPDLIRNIATFLIGSDRCTSAEIIQLNSLK